MFRRFTLWVKRTNLPDPVKAEKRVLETDVEHLSSQHRFTFLVKMLNHFRIGGNFQLLHSEIPPTPSVRRLRRNLLIPQVH